ALTHFAYFRSLFQSFSIVRNNAKALRSAHSHSQPNRTPLRSAVLFTCFVLGGVLCQFQTFKNRTSLRSMRFSHSTRLQRTSLRSMRFPALCFIGAPLTPPTHSTSLHSLWLFVGI